jgi:signal transduction histidine kinase
VSRGYLIVDDDRAAGEALAAQLVVDGLPIWFARSGEDATALALAQPLVAALVRLRLPDTDALSLYEGWQRRPELREVPVLLLGDPGCALPLRPRAPGAAIGYVARPCEPAELWAQLGLLDRLRRERATAEDLRLRNEALGQFAHVVSHDLKAPLRAICSLVDCLAADHAPQLDEDGARLLELVKSRAQRMDGLIRGILQYSAAGRLRANAENVAVEPLVRGVIDALSPPPHIEIQVAGDLPVVRYDRVQLEQVFQNLIGNAITHMDKERGRVRVSCQSTERAWRFEVADNGPGIPESQRERIFEIFQTLAPRDVRESRGIGLAIAKRLVEQNGGSLWVESDEGSCFYFTVPRAALEE